MSGVAGADSGVDGNNIAWFLYVGQPIVDIPPRNVTHARIDPSVKVIAAHAFHDCKQLEEVDLCEGPEEIEFCAFQNCKSLRSMKVPSTVKKIGAQAFIITASNWWSWSFVKD